MVKYHPQFLVRSSPFVAPLRRSVRCPALAFGCAHCPAISRAAVVNLEPNHQYHSLPAVIVGGGAV